MCWYSGPVLYSELYRALWRRRVLVLLGTLLCVAIALIVTAQRETIYTATATVRVEPVDSNNANDLYEASQRLSRSYAEIYTQGAVIRQMTRYMEGQAPPDPTELAAGQLKDLDLLEVRGVASSARRAANIANAGARALEGFSTRERLTLITRAEPPDQHSSPNVKMSLILALVGGFVMSAGAALLLDALLQPIPDPDELERSMDMPVLAVVPRLDLTVRPTSAVEMAPERGINGISVSELSDPRDLTAATRQPRRRQS